MDNDKVKIKRFRTIAWGFKIAWNIDKFTMLLWFIVCGGLAVLPAVALQFNKQTLSILIGFLDGGVYAFSDVIKPIISLGALMIAIGLSSRVNSQFVRLMLYDSYFVGMHEYTMEKMQLVEMTDLLKKEVVETWNSARLDSISLWTFVEGLCFILAKVIGIVALLVTAFSLSTLVFIMSAVYVVIIFIISYAFTGQTRLDRIKDFPDERMIDYYEKISENHGMAKETRIYENTDDVVKQWRKPYDRLQERRMKRQKSAVIRDFISGFGFYAFLIITVGLCLRNVATGTMRPDVFLVVFTLSLNLYNTISGMAMHIVRLDFGLVSLNKQRSFFEYIKPETGGTMEVPTEESFVFEVTDLSFSYSGKPAIKGISFKVEKGEVIALVGANGSGKSTLVKLLLNMYKPDSGEIKLFGKAFDAYHKEFVRNKVGVFFQDYYIFHSSVRENIGVGAVADMDDDEKILEAAKLGGAAKLLSEMPQGLDTLLLKTFDPSGLELSGGEKQRIASSRAHMCNREVLIFDEPASMLDAIAELEQFKNIQGMLNGRTAILISHRIGFARMADKIIMLDDGEIAEMGTHDELISMDGLYAHFFREQAQWYEKSNQ